MEIVEGPHTPFEVFCFNCRVTYPVETRRCVHCGERLASRKETGLAQRLARARASNAAGESAAELGVSVPGFPDAQLPEEEVEESLASRAKLSPFASVWIVLALIGALFRICSGG